MDTGFLIGGRPGSRENDFMSWRGRGYSYRRLIGAIAEWHSRFDRLSLPAGAVVTVESDYTPNTTALLLALLERDAIVAPVNRDGPAATAAEIAAVAPVWGSVGIDAADRWTISAGSSGPSGPSGPSGTAPRPPVHPLIARLRGRGRPGLLLLTSGSSGRPKAVLHDADALLARFRQPRPPLRMPAMLVFEHLGGLNTLFHTLATGGTLYALPDRRPDTVCAAVARHRIEVLPTSPTFLQLMLLSRAHERHDLGSLSLITYGSEAMPQATLDRLNAALPGTRIKQTYGLIEVGAFPSHSRARESLWLKLDVEHRVVDGVLQLRTPAAMLGYLNAPSPFTADGWFVTGDLVECDGEYLRILGRASEVISVGGDKVFPQEVEAVIQELEWVRDVRVHGEPNALMGAVVCARVRVDAPADPRHGAAEVKRHCRARLPRHKVPVKVLVGSAGLPTTRGKKLRYVPPAAEASR
ncbi:fatty acid--CoA ligase family protein [Kitasatospora sp. NPDC056138]|uniref:ANL family adenylate-forming protein n=1 Tax=Kitasatospora sp. NPDC056138 TaxID=3345724 RepID=UPI0035D79D27